MLKYLPFIAFVLVPLSPVAAAEEENWPCVQRAIPQLSAGIMWAGPVIDEAAKALWRSDEQITVLAQRLAARRTDLAETAGLVETYAQSTAKEEKNNRLTALFAGVLEIINGERAAIMTGIRKYTGRQKQLADAIRKKRVAFSAALEKKDKTDTDKQRVRELERDLNWQSRIHEEREHSLQFVCESPVILEQRAFAIAREIQNHLE